MKKLTFVFLIISFISCTENQEKKNAQSAHQDSAILTKPGLLKNDKQNWIQNFKDFRDAIYQHDINRAKKFCNFPILNENNQIWYLIYKDAAFNSDRIIPFTEQDFEKYFNKLFSRRFITSILKIKSDSVNNSGEYKTKEFTEDKSTTYGMVANFDKKESTLELNLWSNSIIKDENGEVQDGGEFSIIYEFSIKEDGSLIFKQVKVAG
jgi:uncharacterized beta-barrel protein YwiB (DUF1934 family)